MYLCCRYSRWRTSRMPIACQFQSAFFEVNDQQNYLTCNNPMCEYFCSLVNSHICTCCKLVQLKEVERYTERQYEKRSQEIVQQVFDTACSQCQNYRKNSQNCRFFPNSKTVFELIEDPQRRCPRNLW